MAKIEKSNFYIHVQKTFLTKKKRGKREVRENKNIRMDGKNVGIDIDTCEMQETHGRGSPYLIQGRGRHTRSARRNSRCNSVARDETNAARYS